MPSASWLSSLKALSHRTSALHMRTPRRRISGKLLLERLEDRLAPATFTVTNTLDDGSVGSLRWAINQANASQAGDGGDLINFTIPNTDTGYQSGADSFTIAPTSALPHLADPNPLLVDGYSQPGFTQPHARLNNLLGVQGVQPGSTTPVDPTLYGDNAILKIELVGNASFQSSELPGLELDTAHCTVQGLVINEFFYGISVRMVGMDIIQGNFIGTDVTGTQIQDAQGNPLGNTEGVSMGGSGDVLGGITPAARNLISGNESGAVDEGGPNNVVEGNFIGTDITGTLPLGNGGFGVLLGPQSFVGGQTRWAGNLISGNANELPPGNTVGVDTYYGAGGVVEGNFIGTDVTGTKPLGNIDGIRAANVGTAPITIGGTGAGANLISGNSYAGITGGGPNLLIEGNFIGTDFTGTAAVANQMGVFLGTNSTLGAAGAGNLISGNGAGVRFSGDSNQVLGNLIGTDWTGTKALGNSDGVLSQDGESDNTVGGLSPGDGNVISGNSIGVFFANTGSGNVVEGNYIGTDITGKAPVPNGHGVEIDPGQTGDTIGGTTAAARNIISGNTAGDGYGVYLNGYTSAGTPSANVVQGNYIGTDVSGTQPLGNFIGVVLYGAVNNTIGSTGGAGNVVAANSLGIVFNYSQVLPTTGNLVEGNWIGTNTSGMQGLGNGIGILLKGASNNTIGGTAAGAGNTIAYNQNQGGNLEGDGVALPYGNAETDDSILGNSIYGNAGKGVDLGYPYYAPAPVLNDSLGHSGPNDYQNFPVLTSAFLGGGSLTVTGTLSQSVTPNTTFRIEFFASSAPHPSGYGQGQSYLGAATVTTDASGNATFVALLPDANTASGIITATATNASTGDTSEFSQDFTAQALPAGGSGESLTLSTDPNPALLDVTVNGGTPTPVLLAGAVFVNTDFGNLPTPATITDNTGGKDTLVANGVSASTTNDINKTAGAAAGQGTITWTDDNPNTALETVNYAGLPNQIINADGTGTNLVTDPGNNTTINGGPGANTIVITATHGNGVTINGGPTTNSYQINLGSLAGPVAINNSSHTAADSLIVNAAAGNNTITAAGNQVTEGAQAITFNAPLAGATINGGSGNNQITVANLTVPVQNLALTGGGGNNTFSLTNVGSNVSSLTLTGGTSGTNQVQTQGSLPTQIITQNLLPVVSAGSSTTIAAATPFTGSGSYFDLSTQATITATVDYGDGAGPQPLSLNADHTFNLSHVYATAGGFTVTVHVTDSVNGTGSTSFPVTVYYATQTTITAPTITYGTAGSVTVTVSSTSVTPTGNVALSVNGGTGMTQALVGGSTTFNLGVLDAGSYSLSASYAAQGNFGASASTGTLQINQASQTITWATPAAIPWGEPFGSSQLDATVSVVGPAPAGALSYSPAAGTVLGPGSQTLTVTAAATTDYKAATASVSLPVLSQFLYVLDAKANRALSAVAKSQVNIPGPILIDSNSSSALYAQDTAQITATTIQVVGGPSINGKATVSPTPTTGITPFADPLASLTGPSTNGLPNNGSVSFKDNAKHTIYPGIYGYINVGGNATVTMQPGMYVLEGYGLLVNGNGSLIGNGVTIYNTNSNYPQNGGTTTGITLSGNGTINLTAATNSANGAYPGVVIYQGRSNTRAMSISGLAGIGNPPPASMTINGTIYVPSAQVAVSGTVTLSAGIVADTMSVTGNGVSTQVNQDGTSAIQDTATAGTLLSGELSVYVSDPAGYFTANELNRILDAITTWNSLLAPYNVTISEVTDPTQANLVLDNAISGAAGSYADGVLGSFSPGEVTMIQGWNWYDGSDPTQIGADQYDFQTVVEHELGHALGLSGSSDPNSAMNETLTTATVRRTLAVADLNLTVAPEGADPERAAPRSTAGLADSVSVTQGDRTTVRMSPPPPTRVVAEPKRSPRNAFVVQVAQGGGENIEAVVTGITPTLPHRFATFNSQDATFPERGSLIALAVDSGTDDPHLQPEPTDGSCVPASQMEWASSSLRAHDLEAFWNAWDSPSPTGAAWPDSIGAIYSPKHRIRWEPLPTAECPEWGTIMPIADNLGWALAVALFLSGYSPVSTVEERGERGRGP
jgi:hypothetical protein